jgi:hypothetical protein
MGQSRVDNHGIRKKITLRCNRYYHAVPVHSHTIDPSDHRRSKSIKTECMAHVNVNRIENSSRYHITLAHWDHNHPSEIPEGAPVRRLATEAEKNEISHLATTSTQTFSRGQISAIMKTRNMPGQVLEPRQIGNIINNARRNARDVVDDLGGDFAAIIASLHQKSQESHGWVYHIKLDKDQVVTGIWWQSPLQAELGQRYGDVLINDNTYNRNQHGYPLNIGIIIDGQARSRNAWYALHAKEDIAHHTWVFQCHLQSAGTPPECLMTDRHRTLISVAKEVLPLTRHLFCIHHLEGNIESNVRRSLGSDWVKFTQAFWQVYRAVSPQEFDHLWDNLVICFPSAREYLDLELYPCRFQWAWAFTSFQFTCGVRTSGRVEVENRVNKIIGGAKKGAKQLFDGLNERTDGQSLDDMIRARDVCVSFSETLPAASVLHFFSDIILISLPVASMLVLSSLSFLVLSMSYESM